MLTRSVSALQPQPSPFARRSLPALLLLLTVLLAVRPPAVRAQQGASLEVADGIAAVVGDEIILRSEVNLRVRQLLLRQSQLSYSPQLWRRALEERINQQLLVEAAQADTTIKVTDQQVQQRLDQWFNQIIQQAGSAEAIEERYGKSILELKEQFRPDIRKQILAQMLTSRHQNEVTITPSEVRAWFENIPQDSLPRIPKTVRLAHIVRYPETTEAAREAARERITAIRDSVVAGTLSIEEAARRYSGDVRSARNGGLYRGFPLSDLEASFAAVAARVPIGEISQVFETSRGFHILRVSKRTGNVVSFNHVLIEIGESLDPSSAIRYLDAVRDSLLTHEQLSFGRMARRHSEEEITSDLGGRVVDPQTGMRDLIAEALGPSWQQSIDTLEIGEISKPTEVELLTGERAYHIVKLQERTPAHRVSLDTDYNRLRQYALAAKQQRVMRQWLAKLREKTYVDVRVETAELADTRR